MPSDARLDPAQDYFGYHTAIPCEVHVLQGTLYPDVIESCPPPGSGQKHSHTIKSHHNVGGLPKDLDFTLIEPLRELFKVPFRQCGPFINPFL